MPQQVKECFKNLKQEWVFQNLKSNENECNDMSIQWHAGIVRADEGTVIEVL